MVVVGFGRLGGALAVSLQRAGYPVTVVTRSEASRGRAREHGLKEAREPELSSAALCLFAVQDAQLGQAVAELTPRLGRRTALVHCAGALTLEDFGAAASKRVRGSFHPLCAVSAPTDSLRGRTVAVSATRPALSRALHGLARDLGLAAIEVPEAHRARYHAGAVFAAGGLVALADAAVSTLEQAGIERDQALAALLPLMQSALEGVKARGLSGGLTGPVARGDAEIVARHLDALPGELAALYALLARRALRLARLPADARAKFAAVL